MNIINKYQPKNFDEFIGNKNIIEAFKNISKKKNIPHIMVSGDHGTGKCHTYNTKILMFDGSIKMVQNIKVGELLMGDDSNPRRVLSLASGTDDLYEVSNKKGDIYGCNSKHILCLKYSGNPLLTDRKNRKSYNIRWFDKTDIKLKSKTFSYKNKIKKDILKDVDLFLLTKQNTDKSFNISIEKYLQLSETIKSRLTGYKVEVLFENKKIPIDPYIIGFWLGDGSSNTSMISNQEAICLRYIKDKVKEYDCYLQYYSQYDYRINSLKNNHNFVLKKLKELNLINNKHIPHIYKCNSRENRLKLLAGLIDSDGSNIGNCYEIIQKNNQLSEDIVYLCRSLGFACYSRKKKSYCIYKGKKIWGEYNRISIYGKGLENIPVLCPRKKVSARKQIKDALTGVINVNYIGNGNYYGFTLDGNHRYLLGNFVVTHNTLLKQIFINSLNIHKNNILYVNLNEDLKKNNIKNNKLFNFLKKPVKNLIIIDNYEEIPLEQQYILRSFIKNYNNHSIFLFFLNNISNIIEQLSNYFLIFKLKPNTDRQYMKFLKNIINEEKLDISKHILKYIIEISHNFREIINNITIVLNYYHSQKNICNKDLELILNISDKKYSNDIISFCDKKDIKGAIKLVDNLIDNGYSITDLVNILTTHIKYIECIKYEKKIKYIEIISFAQIKMINNLNTYTQLVSLLSKMCKI